MNTALELDENYNLVEAENFSAFSSQPPLTFYTRKERNDISMVQAIKMGRPEAENKLVEKFRPGLYAILLRLTGDSGRAEDLAHETLLIVLQRLRKQEIDKPHKLTSYVFATAKYTYFGWLRKKDNQLEFLDCISDVIEEGNNPEDECIAIEERSKLESLINQLSVPRDREILSRHYMNEQSKDEICDAMSLSNQHFDRVISRARGRLKDTVGC